VPGSHKHLKGSCTLWKHPTLTACNLQAPEAVPKTPNADSLQEPEVVPPKSSKVSPVRETEAVPPPETTKAEPGATTNCGASENSNARKSTDFQLTQPLFRAISTIRSAILLGSIIVGMLYAAPVSLGFLTDRSFDQIGEVHF